MNSKTVSSAPIAHIEFHDGRLSSVRVQPEGLVELVFDSLNVYRESAHEQYEIWEYRASLTIEGVVELHVKGAWTPDSAVMTASIDGKDATEGAVLLSPRAIQQFELSLFGGTKLRVLGTRMHMALGEASRFLETWSGPLVSAKRSREEALGKA